MSGEFVSAQDKLDDLTERIEQLDGGFDEDDMIEKMRDTFQEEIWPIENRVEEVEEFIGNTNTEKLIARLDAFEKLLQGFKKALNEFNY